MRRPLKIGKSLAPLRAQITKKQRLLLLMERDEATCQICFEEVDARLSPTDGWGPTADHIIPKSKGGDSSLSNLRLAHRRCNSWRGDSDDIGPRPRAPRRRTKISYSFYWVLFHAERFIPYEGCDDDPKSRIRTAVIQPWRNVKFEDETPFEQKWRRRFDDESKRLPSA